MIQIDDKIISDDVVEKQFVCNLSACKGMCCVYGDSGAPLEEHEKLFLIHQYKNIHPFLTAEGKDAIKKNGLFYKDSDGDWVTTLIDGKQCAYSIRHNRIYECGIEKAYEAAKLDGNAGEEKGIKKPLSCHLYPVRITKHQSFEAVNYDKWDICQPACEMGKKLNVPVYQFVKDALIRKYGMDWYQKLQKAAIYLESEIKE